MANEMSVKAVLAEGMRFDIETGSGHHVLVDAAPHNGGEDSGPRPMELLLVALAGCAGMDVLSILRKKRQKITQYEVRVLGDRTEDFPKVFVAITVEHVLTGYDIQPAAVERALALTEERYCGASIMLGKAARVIHTFRIIEAGKELLL